MRMNRWSTKKAYPSTSMAQRKTSRWWANKGIYPFHRPLSLSLSLSHHTHTTNLLMLRFAVLCKHPFPLSRLSLERDRLLCHGAFLRLDYLVLSHIQLFFCISLCLSLSLSLSRSLEGNHGHVLILGTCWISSLGGILGIFVLAILSVYTIKLLIDTKNKLPGMFHPKEREMALFEVSLF